MKIITFLLFLCVLTNTKAESVNFEEPISISGEFSRQPSPAQQRKLLRQKMEKRTEQMVKKQLQTIRLKQEMKLQKRLERVMNQQMNAINKI